MFYFIAIYIENNDDPTYEQYGLAEGELEGFYTAYYSDGEILNTFFDLNFWFIQFQKWKRRIL